MKRKLDVELILLSMIIWLSLIIGYWDLSKNNIFAFLIVTLMLGFGIASIISISANLIIMLIKHFYKK